MENLDVTIDDLEQELKRRQKLEIAQFRAEIEEHRKAITQIENLIAEIEEQASETEADVVAEDAPPAFGPCATRILGILETSSVSIPGYKLAAITKYSAPMLKKAIKELLAANKIKQTGDSRSTVYSKA